MKINMIPKTIQKDHKSKSWNSCHKTLLASFLSSRNMINPQFNKGIGDAGSTADFRMLWSAMVTLVCYSLL